MDIELQLQLAREYWEDSKGRPDISMRPDRDLTSEEKLAMEELLRKGILKRKKYSYFVCPETKRFIDNGGKTSYELEKEKDENRKEKELEIAKESNKIAKYSIGISIISIILSTSVAIWVTLKG